MCVCVCVCVCVCRKWKLERRAGAVGWRAMRIGPDHLSPCRSRVITLNFNLNVIGSHRRALGRETS